MIRVKQCKTSVLFRYIADCYGSENHFYTIAVLWAFPPSSLTSLGTR